MQIFSQMFNCEGALSTAVGPCEYHGTFRLFLFGLSQRLYRLSHCTI